MKFASFKHILFPDTGCGVAYTLMVFSSESDVFIYLIYNLQDF